MLVDHLNRTAINGIEAHHASLDTIEWMAATVQRFDQTHRAAESLLARARRDESAVSALLAQQDELRAAIAVLQQAAQNLKREVAGLSVGSPAPSAGHQAPAASVAPPANQFDDLDSHKYVAFEDRFRGSSDEIRARVAGYLPIFAGASDVLDIGCGRGEFLTLLREQGVKARGIDVNASMVDVCRALRLDVVQADGLAYLRGLPDGSLGGLFAAQVIEHLEPRYLTQLLDVAFAKLRPGSPIVLETINPACWFAFFESYVRDLTHVRPVHPDTLKYLLIATGFQHVEIQYRAPYPDREKLQPVTLGDERGQAGVALEVWEETLNANVEKINRLLFTYLDYAAIGRRA